MVDTTSDPATDRWLCPDDRQLALRGRLDTGWSTIPDTGYRKSHATNFTDDERLSIAEVMRRASELEVAEQLRIGALVDNVEQTKRSLHGDGIANCLVCGQKSGFLKETLRKCFNCGRVVCNKCSVETSERSYLGEVGKCYYCVVCFEEKELWKRSGAWFFKMLPKYISPADSNAVLGRVKKTNPSVSSTQYDSDMQTDYVDERAYGDSDDSDAEIGEYKMDRNYLTHRNSEAFSQWANTFEIADDDSVSIKTNGSVSKVNMVGMSDRVGNRRHGLVLAAPDSDNDDDGDSDALSRDSEQFRKVSVKSVESLLSSTSSISHDFKRKHSNNSLAQAHEGSLTNSHNVTSDSITSIEGPTLTRQAEERKSTTSRKEYHGSLGMIEFSMKYVEDQQTLNVLIKSAKGLKAMDFGKTSDPYVKLYIVPGHSKSTKHKTKVHYKTLDPVFDEDFSYFGITERDLKKKMIRLAVMDENKLSSNSFIGETYVQLNSLVNRPEQNFKRLLDPYSEHESGTKEDDYRGKIQISLKYVSKKNKLVVGILRCVDLKPMDPNGYSDPYVKCYLLPDKKKSTKRKTRVIKKDLNPKFDEEFSYEMAVNVLAGKTLSVSVWDHDVGSSNDFIGSVALGNDSREDALKHWFEALKFPDTPKIYWHTLTPEMPQDEE